MTKTPNKPAAEDRAPRTPESAIRVPHHVSALYAPDYIEGRLTPRQARAARAICDALQVRGAKVQVSSTGTERVIRGPVEVVRWLLERVADAIEE